MQSYPQDAAIAVDKMENNSEAETNTASTLCMEAVRFNRGQGREEESAPPAEVRFGNLLPLKLLYRPVAYAAIAKRIGLVACFATSPNAVT
jgi:hypothetical protein